MNVCIITCMYLSICSGWRGGGHWPPFIQSCWSCTCSLNLTSFQKFLFCRCDNLCNALVKFESSSLKQKSKHDDTLQSNAHQKRSETNFRKVNFRNNATYIWKKTVGKCSRRDWQHVFLHLESIIDDISAIFNSLLDKLKELSLHCRSSINEDIIMPSCPRLHDSSCKLCKLRIIIETNFVTERTI